MKKFNNFSRKPWWLDHNRVEKDPSKVNEEKVLNSFNKGSVKVIDGDVNKAISRFKKMTEFSGILSEIKKREHYKSPGQKRREKRLKAMKRLRKKQRQDAR